MKTLHANRLNAFVVGDADAIGEVLLSPLGDLASGDVDGFVCDRAATLVGALTPVFVWMRDHKGVALNIDTVRLSFELRSIWKVVTQRVFEVSDPISGETTAIPVPEMPEDVVDPLQAYLVGLPFFDMSLDWDRQTTDSALRQHGFAQFYFTHTFPLLGPNMDRAE
jgi:intracellular multiplication protein IcmO